MRIKTVGNDIERTKMIIIVKQKYKISKYYNDKDIIFALKI